jgi:hypothetical protein
MTGAQVETWLAARRPERPLSLAEHMTHSLDLCDPSALAAAPTMAEAMGLLGIEALKRVVQRQSGSQHVALDLLAADAFVTYAFEAAAEEGVSVEPLVSRLLKEAV